MSNFLRFPTPLLVVALLRCSAGPDSMGSDIHPPLPRTPSIIPLAVNNSWSYTYRSYDSSGVPRYPQKAENLAIPEVYGLRDDSVLVLLDRETYLPDSAAYSEFIYQYEYEAFGYGSLVAYRDRFVRASGLYIVGTYVDDSAGLYDSAVLWLAYPADSGFAYRVGSDSGAKMMEVMSTHEKFYCPSQTPGLSPLKFYDCYHYRETSGDTVWHYYYNDDVGCLGFLQYINGKLRVTGLLDRFSAH